MKGILASFLLFAETESERLRKLARRTVQIALPAPLDPHTLNDNEMLVPIRQQKYSTQSMLKCFPH